MLLRRRRSVFWHGGPLVLVVYVEDLGEMRLISSLVDGGIGRLSLLKRIEQASLPSLFPPVVVVSLALFLIILGHYFLNKKRRLYARLL